MHCVPVQVSGKVTRRDGTRGTSSGREPRGKLTRDLACCRPAGSPRAARAAAPAARRLHLPAAPQPRRGGAPAPAEGQPLPGEARLGR